MRERQRIKQSSCLSYLKLDYLFRISYKMSPLKSPIGKTEEIIFFLNYSTQTLKYVNKKITLSSYQGKSILKKYKAIKVSQY